MLEGPAWLIIRHVRAGEAAWSLLGYALELDDQDEEAEKLFNLMLRTDSGTGYY